MIKSKPCIALGRVLSHDNSATITVNGKIVAAITTERLTGNKHDHDNNDLAISYCLSTAKLRLEDVDVIVQNSPKHYFRGGSESTIIPDNDPRLITMSHHLAHAWSVWATCPFEEATIIVVDGRGNFVPNCEDVVLTQDGHSSSEEDGANWQIEVESIYRANRDGLKLVFKNTNRGLPASIGAPFSRQDGLYPGEYSGYYQYSGLGALYEQVARGLFGQGLDGGKVMGLAAYATPNPTRARQIIHIDQKNQTRLGIRWLFDLGEPIKITDRFEEAAQVAADVQLALEEGMEALVRKAKFLAECKNLCLTGGVSLNCRANERIYKSQIFENIFIQPACNDAGTSIGCAFYGHQMRSKQPLKSKRYSDFLGRSYTKEIPLTLERWEAAIDWSIVENVVVCASEMLSANKVIGWFRGGSEMGPRALGHRSIFSLPKNKSIRDRLNHKIKRREPFRPFGPVVTAEAAPDIFEMEGESPYMLRTVTVRKEFRAALSAVTHVDGTARVQTLKRSDEPVVYALLEMIGSQHELPVLLNTSLNTAGFPIAETPEDAVICLLSSGLDSIFLEGWIASRRFDCIEKMLTSDKPTLFQLLPQVRIHIDWSNDKGHAMLKNGKRCLKISMPFAKFLMESVDLDDLESQLSLGVSHGINRHQINDLFQEGWALGRYVA